MKWIKILFLITIGFLTACGGSGEVNATAKHSSEYSPDIDYVVDGTGAAWTVQERVDGVPILTVITAQERCAIKHTVSVIRAEYVRDDNNLYYFFVRDLRQRIPALGHNLTWADVWLSRGPVIGYWYPGDKYQMIYILANYAPAPDFKKGGYISKFKGIMHTLIHEEMHSVGYSHGPEMYAEVNRLFEKAEDSLLADSSCSDFYGSDAHPYY